jgi:predicted lipoprotein with Yx(FWY)xxD motif
MSVYQPPGGTKVITVNVPFLTLVQRADPDFQWAKKHEPYYILSNGRLFDGDNATTGAYATS